MRYQCWIRGFENRLWLGGMGLGGNWTCVVDIWGGDYWGALLGCG